MSWHPTPHPNEKKENGQITKTLIYMYIYF